MKRSVVVLMMLAGCGEIAGIEDLTSNEIPDSGATPIVDAGADVSSDIVDSSPSIDVGETDKGFRRVFVTSGAYLIYPNAGPGTADTQCNVAARDPDAGLADNDGTWIAWLSSGNVRAVDRLTYAGEYRLVDGTRVVFKKSDLTTGSLQHAIDLNEKGLPADGNDEQRRVWTGTASNGNISNECSGWTATGNLGQFGRAYLADGRWTDDGFWNCGTKMRLYCFEQ
jgi:hypothetical protein